jgi:uncharacterized protein YukE
MAEAEQTKAAINSSIDHIKESVGTLNNLDNSLTAIGADINALKKSIDIASRQVLTAISQMRNGQDAANSVLMGSTGMVSDSLVFMDQANQDLENMVRGLVRMKRELEEMQKGTMFTATRDRGTIISKLKAAAGHLRGYFNTL